MTETEQCGVFADEVLKEIKEELLVSRASEVVTKGELYDVLPRAMREARSTLWRMMEKEARHEK